MSKREEGVPLPPKMEDSTALLSYLIISFLFFLYLLLRRPTTTNHCPYPNPILGNLLPFLRNRHRFLDWAVDLFHHSPASTIQVITPFSLSHGVATANPLVVDHLLRSNFPNYVKGRRIRSALADLVGDGLLVADGSLWFHQRKIASREFTTRSLRSFIAEVVKSHLDDRLLPLLSSAADSDGSVVDFQELLRRFAFDNICAVAFGTDPCSLLQDQNQNQNHHQSFIDAFDAAVEISYARLFTPIPWIWKAKKFLNLGSERRLRAALNVIDDYAMRIVESRKESQEIKKQGLLSRFMAAMEEDGNELGATFGTPARKQRFLRDVVVSFVLAGKDSTSSGLTWFFWLLSRNPRCKSRIHDEISHQKDGEEESKGMPYLHAAITEALRLYPPVPIDSRVAAGDDVLPDGTKVKAGWFADYSAYAMGRSEEIWGREKEEFSPERWLDAKGEFVGADAARFPVFHAGPRACLGKDMAYLQMKTVAAAVMRRFEVEPAEEEKADPPYEVAVTLRMKGGFPVRIKRRV